MRTRRIPATAAAVLLAGVTLGVSQHPANASSCTDPATQDRVIPGDAILNDGQEYVCTDGTLIIMSGYGQQVTPSTGAPGAVNPSRFFTPLPTLPDGFWWRTVTGRIGDCGPRALTRKHPGVIVGYGPGDMQSALFCPTRPWGNGTVNPS